jgi:hypothetical protein
LSSRRKTLAQAIATMEGFYASDNTRAKRNNNPGNIEYGSFAKRYGATGSDGRFAIFPDAASGFKALEGLLLSPAYIQLTVAEAIAKYAPANENDTKNYIAMVCEWTGLQPTSILGETEIFV